MKLLRPTVLMLLVIRAFAQESTPLTLSQADSMFLHNNLMLLSAQYNIGARDALIIQARAYPNPLFTADLNAFDPEQQKAFHINQTGQKAFSIEQLILLGGKRKAEIDIALQNKKLALLELSDLLRNLRYQLEASFYTIYQQSVTLAKFSRQLQVLDTLISSYEIQAGRGNIPLKDVIRLKAVYFKTNNDKSELANRYFSEQQKMQLILQHSGYVAPIVNAGDFDRLTTVPSYEQMLDSAMENRPDLKIADEAEALALMNVRLQQKMAIPDMAINSTYDQRGGAFLNQLNVGVSIPLPLWNRNQGNIRAAKYGAQSMAIYQKQKNKEVEAEVLAAWQDLTLSISEYQKIRNFYSTDFDVVFEGINRNFQRRNISILEFVDFFESYNESLSEYERVRNYLATSAMQVNYVTASKIF